MLCVFHFADSHFGSHKSIVGPVRQAMHSGLDSTIMTSGGEPVHLVQLSSKCSLLRPVWYFGQRYYIKSLLVESTEATDVKTALIGG